MTSDQPLTGDELATIKASVTYVNGVPMHIAGLSARTTLRLVAEIERLQARAVGSSEEWKHGNASGGGSIHGSRDAAESAMAEHNHRRDHRTGYDLLEPAPPESTGIERRSVTEWEPA